MQPVRQNNSTPIRVSLNHSLTINLSPSSLWFVHKSVVLLRLIKYICLYGIGARQPLVGVIIRYNSSDFTHSPDYWMEANPLKTNEESNDLCLFAVHDRPFKRIRQKIRFNSVVALFMIVFSHYTGIQSADVVLAWIVLMFIIKWIYIFLLEQTLSTILHTTHGQHGNKFVRLELDVHYIYPIIFVLDNIIQTFVQIDKDDRWWFVTKFYMLFVCSSHVKTTIRLYNWSLNVSWSR